jgi:transposase
LAGGINANLLFKWRRDHLHAMRPSGTAAPSAVLVPVHVVPDVDGPSRLSLPPPASPTTAVDTPCVTRSTGVIELDIAGAQLRLRGMIDEASLRSVLRALRDSK